MPGRAVFDQHKPNALRDGLCNAMTTVSALVFLHGPNTRLAAIAVVHMDEFGQGSAAAAMACTILAITAG